MPAPISPSSCNGGCRGAGTLLSAAFSQSNRLLDLTTPLGPDCLLAETLDAAEQIGLDGYRLALTALSQDAHIDLSTLVGQSVRLRLRTALGVDRMRVWHGHVTAARFEAANGGFARYRLCIEPWTAFLRGRRDSYAFNDMAVFDIVEHIFADYRSRGALVPAWQWRVADRTVYTRRSLTTQYQETDFAFVERLLAEEGLFCWYEHADGEDGALGSHVLVIADHNDAFPEDPQGVLRIHRADVTEPNDTIQSWSAVRGWQAQRLAWSSWDYRGMDTRPVAVQTRRGETADVMDMADVDYPGQYAYEDTDQGERMARNAAAARLLRERLYDGVGTVRTLAAGSTFVVSDGGMMSCGGPARYAVLAVRHRARNNFNEDMGQAIRNALGQVAGWDAPVDFYNNSFTAFSTTLAYRPVSRDGHGARPFPKPTVTGPQTALVIGDGGPVHTDRDHRIKVQFHWQRGRASSSRLLHPSGDENAPGSSELGTWVRVAEALAGGDWGGHFLPRVGQEVLVEFMHGDIDRPVVVAALYNGAGAVDAQYNRIQSAAANATGNAPAWYAGQQAGHGHNAVLSGIKTQALSASAGGTGGHSRLVFDDTPGQGRLELATTQANSRLRLGHLKLQRDNERLDDLGHGGELASQAAVAVRAGEGLLFTGDARPGGSGCVLDSREASMQMRESLARAGQLAASAHGANAEPGPEAQYGTLPALEALRQVGGFLEGTQACGDSHGGGGCVTAYGQAHMQFSAPAGIAQYTPAAVNTVAGGTLNQVARDINWCVGKTLFVGAADGLVLYTRGMEMGTTAGARAGLRLHAATGNVAVLSNSEALVLHADRDVTVASCAGETRVRADERILATAGGAYLRVQAGAIHLHAPGKIVLKAARHVWLGPASLNLNGRLPSGGPLCEARLARAGQDGGASVPIRRA